jgi:nucleoside-diphosphate-sugar epimerase
MDNLIPETDFEKIVKAFNEDFSFLRSKTILVTGGTGLVGRYLLSFLTFIEEHYRLNLQVIALGRSQSKFAHLLPDVSEKPEVRFIEQDIQKSITVDNKLDFIIHLASNASPALCAAEPISTELTCIIGTNNLLALASRNPGCRFLMASSGDVYGSPSASGMRFKESDFGSVDCASLHSVYSEGKRAAETLCHAYQQEKKVDFVIARLCRIFGPTLSDSDNKGISEFIRNAAKKEPLVLKSSGLQTYSYMYVGDIVAALLFLLKNGCSGETYNVANNSVLLSLKELALFISSQTGVPLSLLAQETQNKPSGYSSFSGSILDTSKIESLGFCPLFDIKPSLLVTVSLITKELEKKN